MPPPERARPAVSKSGGTVGLSAAPSEAATGFRFRFARRSFIAACSPLSTFSHNTDWCFPFADMAIPYRQFTVQIRKPAFIFVFRLLIAMNSCRCGKPQASLMNSMFTWPQGDRCSGVCCTHILDRTRYPCCSSDSPEQSEQLRGWHPACGRRWILHEGCSRISDRCPGCASCAIPTALAGNRTRCYRHVLGAFGLLNPSIAKETAMNVSTFLMTAKYCSLSIASFR